MRAGGRRRAGQVALLALLLQLALPLLTAPQATASAGLGGPFVICTGSGLVWIDPAAGAAGEDAPDGERAHYCPICFSQQLAALAQLPAVAHLRPLRATAAWQPARAAPVTFGAAPPLPARGPPSPV